MLMPMRMIKESLENQYFNWLYDIVCNDRFADFVSYKKLLGKLHDTEFVYIVPMDENRFDEGVGMRYKFAQSIRNPYLADRITGPCSVLEMMIALAIDCEKIMDDLCMGDRTGQWFWSMIVNLGLGGMRDDNYDERYVDDVIDRFLHREYEPDGRGGLFKVRDSLRDMRDLEIWHQALAYLNSIT